MDRQGMDRQDIDSQTAREAAFALQRAQTSAYYASKYLAEHPGSPDARRALQEAQGRCQEALERVVRVETQSEESGPPRQGH